MIATLLLLLSVLIFTDKIHKNIHTIFNSDLIYPVIQTQ